MRLLIIIIIFIFSCRDELDHHEGIFNYSIDLKSPNSDAKKLGEKILIDITFESGLGKTIHNINIKIYDKLNIKKEVFNEPFESHIHGKNPYIFKREINLSDKEGFYVGDWVLEAKVWAKKEAEAIKKKISFSIK